MRVIVKGSLGFKQPRSAALDSGGHEGLWAQAGSRANTRDALGAYKPEGVFWIRAGEKERFGHGQTLMDACEGRFGSGKP